MATIDQCKKLLEYRAGKAGYNGYISPQDFNLVFASAEQRYYNALYEVYAATEKISDALSVHLSDPIDAVVESDGRYNISGEIQHIDSITHSYNGTLWPVKRVEKMALANHLNSEYDAPDEQFPIYTRYSGYLQFYPITLATAQIVYLSKLVPAVWAYTMEGTSGRERPVYDAANSVQPKWLDADIDKIIYMALSDIGVNMNDASLQQFAERKTQTER